MSFTSPPMILGWFTETPSWRGRVGTRILESGLAVRISRLESASESAGSEVLGGAGVIGDSIGITDTQFMTTTGTTPRAGRSTTGTASTEIEVGAAVTVTGTAAELVAAATQRTGLPLAGAAELTTVPAQHPGLSTETLRLIADTANPAARAASARAPSAATSMAERPEAIRHVEAPAWVAEDFAAADLAADAAVVAGAGNRRDREI